MRVEVGSNGARRLSGGRLYGPKPSPEVSGGKRRVLLAGFFHQTNTFVEGCTRLADFEILRAGEMLRSQDILSPLSEVVEALEETGWEILPVLDMRAVSGGTVADSVVDLFWAEFRAVADREEVDGIDGVFLMVHGAMVSESLPDVEGEILRRIRGVPHLSSAPICGVMDPHANFTEAMGRQSDGLIAYQEHPADIREAASLACTILDGLMQTEDRLATVWDHPPIMWPLSGTAPDSRPLHILEERARELEDELADILAVNVLAGFPYADMPEAGVSFFAVTNGDLDLSRSALRELNVIASSLREAGTPSLIPLEQAMARLEYEKEGPVLLVEPSDNIEAGAAGDATHVLRALVEHNVPESGVIINDPQTVAALAGAKPGDIRNVEIGGKSGEIGSEALPLEVVVVSRSDGRFVPEHQSVLSVRREVDMGDCAVVRHEGVTVLLTSRRTPPIHLGQWRSQGVDPEELFVIGVKAITEHRRAYLPIARTSYLLDLPGPGDENLRRLPFKNVARPIYPLDEL